MTHIEQACAFVNGIHIYYEVHDAREGTPLVLVHGGGSTTPDRGWSRTIIAADLHK